MFNPHLKIFSLGGDSNWSYIQAANTLFDCGEGCATHFRNSVYAIERVLHSHNHGDHQLGLLSLINRRSKGRGDREKPLDIFLPDDFMSQKLYEFINARWQNLPFKLNFHAIYDGFSTPIAQNIRAVARQVKHGNAKCFHWIVIEKRSKLKDEFRGLPPGIIAEKVKEKIVVNESYEKSLLAYGLDVGCVDSVLSIPEMKGVERYIADCTFLDEKDRDDKSHLTLKEAVKIRDHFSIPKVYAAHPSARYSKEQFESAAKNVGFIPVYGLYKDQS